MDQTHAALAAAGSHLEHLLAIHKDIFLLVDLVPAPIIFELPADTCARARTSPAPATETKIP